MNNKPINPSPELVEKVGRAIVQEIGDLGSDGFMPFDYPEKTATRIASLAIQAMPDACAIVDKLMDLIDDMATEYSPAGRLEQKVERVLNSAAEFKKQWGE